MGRRQRLGPAIAGGSEFCDLACEKPTSQIIEYQRSGVGHRDAPLDAQAGEHGRQQITDGVWITSTEASQLAKAQ